MRHSSSLLVFSFVFFGLAASGCSSESSSDGSGDGGSKAATATPQDGGTGAALKPGSARAALSLKNATGNANTAPFATVSSTVVVQGNVADVMVSDGTRSFDLLVQLPATVGTRSLDGGNNALSYAHDGNKKSWLAKDPPGKLVITAADAKTFSFTVESTLVPSGYVNTDSTGNVDVSGSGEVALP